MKATIIGVGSYLPPEIRKNDWWKKTVIESWKGREVIKRVDDEDREWFDGLSEGQRAAMRESEALSGDPFRGAVERRIMPEGMLSSEMETLAAETAIADAGIDKRDIDLLIVQSIAPDYLHVANACAVHRNLGLGTKCMVFSMEMACNSFLQQFALAEAQLVSRRSHCALIVQSCSMSRFLDWTKPSSAWFGDGAGAAVLGVSEDDSYGLLGISHTTYSNQFGLVVTGIPGGHWYDGGKAISYVPNRAELRRLFTSIADEAAEVLSEAAEQANIDRSQVSFLASHQATPWLPNVVQTYGGLPNAKTLNTYKSTASLMGANLPHILDVARREKMIRKGDLVALFSGAAGTTVCGAMLRWSTD